MIRLGCTKGCSQEDQRKLILPASRRRSACELSIFLWGGYLTKAKPRGMQWKEEGVGGKLKWRGSPGTKADYINSRGGLARGSEGRKDVCPGSHWPTCFLEISVFLLGMVVLLDWPLLLKHSINLANVWYCHHHSDGLGLAEFSKEQLIMEAPHFEFERNLLDGNDISGWISKFYPFILLYSSRLSLLWEPNPRS